MLSATEKSMLEGWPETTIVHILSLLSPSSLSCVAPVSRGLARVLRGDLPAGASVWRAAFAADFWAPSVPSSLAKVPLPAHFCWQRECIQRLRRKRKHREHLGHLARESKSGFVFRKGWVDIRDDADCAGMAVFEYAAHRAREVRAVYSDSDEVCLPWLLVWVKSSRYGRAGCTINGRRVASTTTFALMPQPTGARRLRYFEIEILSPGQHGFISCGAVVLGKPAINLRNSGSQPGWGAWGACQSVGYHGDDGRLYPGPSDGNGEYAGDIFGPRFSMPGGSRDASLSPAGPRPIGSTESLETRVAGVGVDIDRLLFFFTVDGALVGEVQMPGIDPCQCVPAVGLHSPGEKVRINLGLCPFWFPIEEYSIDQLSVPKWQNPEQWSTLLDT